MTYVNTMKSEVFVFMALKSEFMHFSTHYHLDFYEKEVHSGVTKRIKKINLEISSFRLSYSGDYLHGSFSWDVLEESLLIIVFWG